MRPCIDCGTPADATRCEDCRKPHRAAQVGSSRARGYDAAWDKLSRRARRMSPLCEDCGEADPDRLTTDHTPEAWARKAAGKVIRLRDVAVVCRRCQVARGSSRPGSDRARADVGEGPAGKVGGLRAEAQGPSHTPGGYA